MGKLDGKKVAILVAPEGVEQIELTDPKDAVEKEGAQTTLISTEAGEVQAFNHLDKGDTFQAEKAVKDVAPDDFDALLLPGGVANPDFLRTDTDAVGFVREFAKSGKPIGVICHGAWILVEAGAVDGRRLTSYPSLQTDLRNAGADWVDEEVVVDGPLVSSRTPDDLPAFDRAVVEAVAAAGSTAG